MSKLFWIAVGMLILGSILFLDIQLDTTGESLGLTVEQKHDVCGFEFLKESNGELSLIGTFFCDGEVSNETTNE